MLHLKVEGITCEGCARSIRRAVAGAAPGSEAAVDVAAGTVTVDGPADRTLVVKAIEDAGFDVSGEG